MGNGLGNPNRSKRHGSTISSDLRQVRRVAAAAAAASRRPPPSGKRRPWTAAHGYLDRDGWRLVWRVVDYLRERHFELFCRFLHERTIAEHIIDLYVEQPDTPPTVRAIVGELERIASDRGTWIVQVPVAHAMPPAETVPLGERAMLVMAEQERDWKPAGSHLADPFAVQRHLGDELTVRTRWLRGPSDEIVDVDTRWSSAILLVEDGTPELAVDVALARARIAVSVWTLLKRPRRSRHRFPAWPTVSLWAPAPYLLHGLLHRQYVTEFGKARGTASGNFVRELGLYKLPTSSAALTAPFVAMSKALDDNDCAVALLAAARWLYLADHEPNMLTRPERLFSVWSAREALCERGRRGQGGTDERWAALLRRLGVRAHLQARGYDPKEVEAALAWSKSVRDLTGHRADSILVGLDFKTQRRAQMRGADQKLLGRNDLALAVFTSRWPILLEAVRYSTRILTRRAIEHDWDVAWFHDQFEARRRRGT
jgi:hypothetical protein